MLAASNWGELRSRRQNTARQGAPLNLHLKYGLHLMARLYQVHKTGMRITLWDGAVLHLEWLCRPKADTGSVPMVSDCK